MIDYINSWAKGIIFAIIIAGIIEIILPEGNNKKYIKTIIGIYIVFVVIYPLISKFSSNNMSIDSIINKANTQVSTHDFSNEILDTNAYIEEIYKKKIEDDIKNNMKDKGYVIYYLSLDIESENEERYGEIKSINMRIDKAKEITESNTSYTVNSIDEVKVNISNNTVKEEKNNNNEVILTHSEITTLKQFLSSTYNIEYDEIHINE